MHPRKGYQALAFRSVSKADTGVIHDIELAPEQSERFFDPIEEIAQHVRCGPSHTLVLIEADGASAGFFVLRPDHRTTAAWWLAWLAIGLEYQGAGLGRAALENALRRLQNVPGIRFVRLLVVRENEGARRLYDATGFRVVGTRQGGTELVMELSLNRGQTPVFEASGEAEATRFLGRHRRFRIRPRSGRHIAPVIGTERGPPVGCTTSAGSRRVLPKPAGSFRVPGCWETEERLVGLTDLWWNEGGGMISRCYRPEELLWSWLPPMQPPAWSTCPA